MSQPFAPRRLLLPLVPVYRLALAIRELRLGSKLEPVRRLRFPVVSIGNLSTGGTGKTPFTIALAQALTRRGLRVDVLSRGYGRKIQRPARVRPEGTAEEFGDEPLLIALQTALPVYVAAQRYQAGLLAEIASPIDGPADSRPAVHLLDDGFQHRQLHRDVDILLMNREDWGDRLLPAGNLREPLRAALRATVIAIPGDDPKLGEELNAWGWHGPIWRLHRKVKIPSADGPLVAFCGIARPQQFFQGLESAGSRLAAQFVFSDHHRYRTSDIERLVAAARNAGATGLITTEKDLVRLGKLAAAFPEPLSLKTALLRIDIQDENKAIGWLVSRLVRGS